MHGTYGSRIHFPSRAMSYVLLCVAMCRYATVFKVLRAVPSPAAKLGSKPLRRIWFARIRARRRGAGQKDTKGQMLLDCLTLLKHHLYMHFEAQFFPSVARIMRVNPSWILSFQYTDGLKASSSGKQRTCQDCHPNVSKSFDQLSSDLSGMRCSALQ